MLAVFTVINEEKNSSYQNNQGQRQRHAAFIGVMQTSACNGRGREPRVNKLHARRGAADARQQKKFQLSSFDSSRSRQIKNYRDSEGHVQRQDGSLRAYPIPMFREGGPPGKRYV